VNQATPVITWATARRDHLPDALSATQLDATASRRAGTFGYAPLAGSVPTAGCRFPHVTFAPTDAVDYARGHANRLSSCIRPTPVINLGRARRDHLRHRAKRHAT